jgi:uncharacterized coiled-coil protein SlyX
VDIAERAAEVDQIKGSTLEEISQMVEQINREFKNKQAQLQPLIAELKVGDMHPPSASPSLLMSQPQRTSAHPFSIYSCYLLWFFYDSKTFF